MRTLLWLLVVSTWSGPAFAQLYEIASETYMVDGFVSCTGVDESYSFTEVVPVAGSIDDAPCFGLGPTTSASSSTDRVFTPTGFILTAQESANGDPGGGGGGFANAGANAFIEFDFTVPVPTIGRFETQDFFYAVAGWNLKLTDLDTGLEIDLFRDECNGSAFCTVFGAEASVPLDPTHTYRLNVDALSFFPDSAVGPLTLEAEFTPTFYTVTSSSFTVDGSIDCTGEPSESFFASEPFGVSGTISSNCPGFDFGGGTTVSASSGATYQSNRIDVELDHNMSGIPGLGSPSALENAIVEFTVPLDTDVIVSAEANAYFAGFGATLIDLSTTAELELFPCGTSTCQGLDCCVFVGPGAPQVASQVVSLTAGTPYRFELTTIDAQEDSSCNLVGTLEFIAPNDECLGAIAVSDGTTPFDTRIATSSPDAYTDTLCDGTFLGAMSQDLWFEYTASGTGTATFSTCESFDTDLVVYEGSCGFLSQVACNGDFCSIAGGSGPDYSSQVEYDVTAGTTYLVRVGGWEAGLAGPGALSINIGGLVRGDCNDDGGVNIADAVWFLGNQFPAPGTPPNPLVCDDACDANDDGLLNIADGVNILNALFAGGSIPAPNACGPDPTADLLGCGSYTSCP